MTTLAPAPPVVHGPTWRRDERGRFVLPRWTLGWQSLGWTAEALKHPDGPRVDQPWEFTDEQARLWLWWYAVNERGEFVYRYGLIRRLKGWGKDPLISVMCANELIGPCRFGGWDDDGQPIAVAHPAAWVQVAAVSKEQTKNTMTLFAGLFTEETISQYALDIGRERIYAFGGRRRLEAVTSSPRTMEGPRVTFGVKNETQHWHDNNDGHEMAEVMARNVGKSPDGAARLVAITNAHRIGEDSDAERDWKAHQPDEEARPDAPCEACLGGETDLLYDSIEAPADTVLANAGSGCLRRDERGAAVCPGALREREDRRLVCDRCGDVAGTSLRAGLEIAKAGSYWTPVRRLEGEIQDPRTDPNQARRFYLNQLRSEVNSWLSAAEWDAAEDADYVVPDGALIALGFDGSRTRDATAIIATELRTGYQWVIGEWERPDLASEDWEVPAADVDIAMSGAFATWRVERLYADPYWWEETIATWAGRWGSEKVIAYPTNANAKKVALAIKSFEKAVRMRGREAHDIQAELAIMALGLDAPTTVTLLALADQSRGDQVATRLTHERSEVYGRHIGNAVKKETGFRDEDGERLYLIGKESAGSPRKMDLAMAGVLSWAARNDAIASGALRGRARSVYEERGVRRA